MGEPTQSTSKNQVEQSKRRLPKVSMMELAAKCKRLERALAESERAYHELADSLPQTVFEIDKNGSLTFTNKHGFQAFRYSEEDFAKGLTAFQLLIPEHRERGRENILKVLAGKISLGHEYEMLRKDGTTFPAILFSTRIMRDDQPWGLRGIIIDITALKQAEEALRHSEEKYKALFEHKLDGIVVIDEKMRLLLANQAAADILDSESVEALLGINIFDYLASEDRTRAASIITQDLFKSDKRQLNEFRVLTRTGREIWIEAVGTLFEYEGKPAGLCSFRDITERKQSEEKLRLYQKELRTLYSRLSLVEEKERQRIAAEVHDRISQNLIVGLMRLKTLKKSIRSARVMDEYQKITDIVQQAVDETRSLAFEIASPLLHQFGLEAALEHLIETTQEQYGIVMKYKTDRTRKPLESDVSTLLFQAVQELLMNVVKHAKAHNVEVCVIKKDNSIRITVEDDGVGFARDKPGRDYTQPKGFGLLSIQERLNYIGGDMRVESVPGSGTCVEILAPLDESVIDKE